MPINLIQLEKDAEDSSTLRMCEAIEMISKILRKRNW